VDARAGASSESGVVNAPGATSFAFVSVFGATGALQHPLGAEAWAPAIAAQQPWDATSATGALQHAGRPAASTGASTSAQKKAAANLLRFIMRTRPVKIPAGTRRGKSASTVGLFHSLLVSRLKRNKGHSRSLKSVVGVPCERAQQIVPPHVCERL